MRRLITALFLSVTAGTCAASTPAAADVATRIQRRLEQYPVLRAEFTQEKQMAAFKKPLLTRGRLVLARGEGVVWQIDAPLKLTYAMSESRIVEIAEDGKATVRNAKDLPGIVQVGRVFRALLSANLDALADTFTVAQDGTPEAWRFVLTPKAGPVSQFMRRIRLTGSRYVDRIVIEETNGDTTTIVFRSFTEHNALTADERAWFGARQ